jgi:hypothetical protein
MAAVDTADGGGAPVTGTLRGRLPATRGFVVDYPVRGCARAFSVCASLAACCLLAC